MSKNTILLITTLLTALSSGLLYAYACSVNPGLHLLSDSNYLSAMQSINRAILNPVFFIGFLGPVFLLPLTTWLYYDTGNSVTFRYLLLATGLYVFGVFGVTMLFNVPLNNALDIFDITKASSQEMAAQRAAFEGPWGNWHLVRTIAAVISTAFVLVAILSGKNGD